MHLKIYMTLKYSIFVDSQQFLISQQCFKLSMELFKSLINRVPYKHSPMNTKPVHSKEEITPKSKPQVKDTDLKFSMSTCDMLPCSYM